MLPILRPFLKKDNPSPADLRGASEVVQTKLAEVNERIAELSERRTAALINGIAYKEIDNIETDLRHAGYSRDQLTHVQEELAKMLSESELKTKLDEREAVYSRAFQLRQEGLHLFEEYDEAIRPVIAILEKIQQVEQQTSDANARLRELDEQLNIPQEERHYVEPLEAGYWGETIPQYPAWSILDQTRLVDIGIARSFVWPKGWSRL